MHELPEELLQHIIGFLDVAPPSVTHNQQEPSLESLFSSHCPLKALSLVSRQYHRLVDPVLFQYLRVHVDQIPLDEPPVLPNTLDFASGDAGTASYQLRPWIDPDTGASFLARLFRAERAIVHLRKEDGVECSIPVGDLSATDQHYIDLLYDHVLAKDAHGSDSLDGLDRHGPRLDFLSFLARKRRTHRATARSLVIFDTGGPAPGKRARLPSWQRGRVWDALGSYANPARLVIIASPTDLAALVSCFTDTTDEWAFDIPFQRVELVQDGPARTATSERERNYAAAARFQSSSALFMRYWTGLQYDEGSSLNAYGTYHYFEKVGNAHAPSRHDTDVHILQRPPSILNRSSLKVLGLGTWLRRLAYTAVFPHFVHFSAVLDTLAEFRALADLALQLAPDARSTLLDDQRRVGRGNMRLADCWSELEQCYAGVAARLLAPGGGGGSSGGSGPASPPPLALLARFEPRDYRNQFLRDMLNRILDGLGPHWSRCEDGAWVKGPLPALPAPAAAAAAAGGEGT